MIIRRVANGYLVAEGDREICAKFKTLFHPKRLQRLLGLTVPPSRAELRRLVTEADRAWRPPAPIPRFQNGAITGIRPVRNAFVVSVGDLEFCVTPTVLLSRQRFPAALEATCRIIDPPTPEELRRFLAESYPAKEATS